MPQLICPDPGAPQVVCAGASLEEGVRALRGMGRFPVLRCPVRGGDGRLPAQDGGDLFTVVGGAAE